MGFVSLETENKHSQYINSIIRATNILELFGSKNAVPLGIAEISKELGLQKTTVFNIVKTLARQGWLVQDAPNGKYKLGSKLLMISSASSFFVILYTAFLSSLRNCKLAFGLLHTWE